MWQLLRASGGGAGRVAGRRRLHTLPKGADGALLLTVTVAMSGGVDSSVTALLLAQADVNLRAVYMRNWSTLDESGSMAPGSGGASGCEWQKEWEDVQRVCRHLGGIPVELVNLSREYWVDVFEPALGQWADGVTPNPDVECNRSIKFGALLERIHTPWLATGHYARIERSADRASACLRRAVDASKDQSYYLSSVREDALIRSIFPLGGLLKHSVRELARKHALPTAEKDESMGLCFVGERGGKRGFARFLDGYVEASPGDICMPDGQVIGRHSGLHSYTVGQRARVSGLAERYFVARKDPQSNTIIVVPGSTHPMLECTSLSSQSFSWISRHGAASLASANNLAAQVRYRQAPVPCQVTSDGERVTVTARAPVYAVTQGQYVALYDKDICLGSGIIDQVQTRA